MERLRQQKYGRVLCYPRYDPKELEIRLGELRWLGVEAIVFTGGKSVFDTPVLGRGCVGLVVLVKTRDGKSALKIRRVDADRDDMQREAEMLLRANSVGVGPSLLGTTKDFLLMEFIDGTLLPRWIENKNGLRISRVLLQILEQCWRLDEAGLDHGELGRAPKHLIIDENDNPHIVDFETASTTRRVSNVTSICQYLFLRSQVAAKIEKKLGEINKGELIYTLRDYKQERTRKNLEKVLKICGLKV